MSDGNRIADDALSSVIVHCQKDSVIDVNYKKKSGVSVLIRFKASSSLAVHKKKGYQLGYRLKLSFIFMRLESDLTVTQ